MPLHAIRPENRTRGARSGAEGGDTVAVCFRSEGFAEDLHDPAEVRPLQASLFGGRVQWVTRTARSVRSALPGLGLMLAGLLGPLGH
jgi:hypothetical protein